MGKVDFGVCVRPAARGDEAEIAAIYNWYIEQSTATFELEPVTDDIMLARMTVPDGSGVWLVACINDELVGYAYAGKWKLRPAYSRSRETSVYVKQDRVGRGIGKALMQGLIDVLKNEPIHILIAGITLPNAPSVALHEKLGFKPVGHFEEVGYKFGSYADVGYWQLIMDSE